MKKRKEKRERERFHCKKNDDTGLVFPLILPRHIDEYLFRVFFLMFHNG